MKIKRYSEFNESIVVDLSLVKELIDINESLSLWHNVILDSIGAVELDIIETFNLDKNDYENKLHIEYLSDNVKFLNAISSVGLKKSKVEDTDDYNTFISKSCKFMFIYRTEASELENPEYVIFQTWDERNKEWEECKLYQIKEDIKKFYDKLSSRVIELDSDGHKYVYNTSNGTEWILQNINDENGEFKKYLRKADLEELLNNSNIKMTIV